VLPFPGESTSQIFFVSSGTVLLKQKIRPHVHAVELIARENQKAAREANKGGSSGGDQHGSGGKHRKHAHGQAGAKKSGEGEEKKDGDATGQTGVDGVLTVGSLAPPPLAVRAHHIVGNASGSTRAHTVSTFSSDPLATAGSDDTPPSQRTPVMPVRRSVGAASKTKPDSTHLPFSSSTHGFGHLGGSNLEYDRAQVIELGRIGPGSFFAEEGIVIEMQQEHRSYTAVADERVVCYALDRIAFHKSIKGSILAMLQDMAHSKKHLREERVNSIIRNYITAQTGGHHQNQTVQTVLASTTSRRSRPSPPASSTSSSNSAPLSIFHPPVRSKPLNCRHFGVIRVQGQVPRILDEDGGGESDAAREMGLYDQEVEGEEAAYAYRPTSGASSRSRRGSMHSLVEDDVNGTGAPIVSIGSGILSNMRRHNRHGSTASGGSVTLSRSETEALLLASAQARSLPHTRVVKDAVVQKRAASRSRSRSRSRARGGESEGEESRPNTAGTERSRPSTGGRRATTEAHVREAAPIYNIRPHQSTHQPPPPVEGPHPMIAASTLYALLGKKLSSTTPLAILTSSAIPLSALSALSPQPLPLRALLPSTLSAEDGGPSTGNTTSSSPEEARVSREIAELEVRQRQEEEEAEKKKAAEAAARVSKDAARAHSRQQKDLRRALHAELSRAMSIREGNEQEQTSAQASARGSISAAAGAGAPLPGSAQAHPDDAAKSDSDKSGDDASDEDDDDHDDDDRSDAISPSTLASLQTSSAASRLEAAREEQRAREAWKTSPRRLSVLSRVMGIGTGQGSARVKDSETGTVLLDTTLAAKLAEEAVGNADMQELKRKHIMASLQRSAPSEPNTAREPFSAREPLSARPMDSSRGSSRSISPARSQAALSISKLSSPAGSVARKESEEEKTGTGVLQQSTSKSHLTTLLRTALADDPLLSSEQYYTSRSSGPFLFGSGQTLSVPATLSPFVLGAVNAAVQSPSEDGHPRVPSLPLPMAPDQSHKHRFVPLEPDALAGGVGGSKSARNSREGLFPALTSAQASTSRSGRRHAKTMSLNAGLPLAHMHSGRTQYVQLGRASAQAVMQAETSKRPYVSLSRAGMSKFGQNKVDLQAAKEEIANKASEGVQAPAADGSGKLVYVYTHANSTSVGGSHPSHPSASQHHQHQLPGHHPHHAPSGPSLLAASTVSAIERFLHTQLLLEQETTFAANPAAREGAITRAGEEEKVVHLGRRHGKTTTQMNIRKLEAMAFRGVRRTDDSAATDGLPMSPSSSQLAFSPGASSSPLPSPSSSHLHGSHASRRANAAFSMAALLSLEKSEVPKFANAPPVAVSMTQHFRRQLAEPF
jgi:hypothetical protein